MPKVTFISVVASPGISPVFVARRWRCLQIQGVATEADAGVVVHYVEKAERAQRSRCRHIRRRSRSLVRYPG
jgi:hypothetical protein